MKKYIPVFGPQELFDGCLNDVVCVSKNDDTGEICQYISIVVALRDLTKYKGDSDFTVAMRRIKETPDSQLVVDGMPSFYVGSSGACTHKMAESDIPVWCNDVDDTCTAMGFINDCLRLTRKPNRWTIADQKAGRLPEVGAKCRQGHKDEIVVAVTEKFVVTECQDMSVCTTRKDVFMRSYNPIETPDEKAVRLREEWCIKALSSCSILSGMQKYELKRLGAYIADIYDALLSGELMMPGKVDE